MSFGKKVVLINSGLQSIFIYLVADINLPKCVIHDIYKLFVRFLMISSDEGRRRYWFSWKEIYLSKNEGDLGFRSLYDVSKALFTKFWWIFRRNNSLRTNFMWNKYCKMYIPQLVE